MSAKLDLCEPCGALWMRWLDYKMPPLPIHLMSVGDSIRETRFRQERRFKEWRDTIRFEQDLIECCCKAGNHVKADDDRNP